MSDFLNIERLRKEAKTLLRQIRAGDTSSVERVRPHLQRLSTLDTQQLARQIQLADVHQALARERGYENWAELKSRDAPLERFLTAVRSGALEAAQRELGDFPNLAAMSIHAACAIGDSDAVRYHLDLDPESIRAEHAGWQPLIYACASRFHQANPRHAVGILDCVSLLLDRGANPNAHTLVNPSDPESRVTALDRANASQAMDREKDSQHSRLPSLLRQRGAETDARPMSKKRAEAFEALMPRMALSDDLRRVSRADPKFTAEIRKRLAPVRERFFSRSPNSDESKDPPSLPLFLTEPDVRKVAIELAEFVLERGISVNIAVGPEGSTFLHEFARLKGYPQIASEAVEWLLLHGADPNLPRGDGLSPFSLAVRFGNTAAAEVMRAHGADPNSIGPMDELIGACRSRNAHAAGEILRRMPEVLRTMSSEGHELFVSAAADNCHDDVRFLAQLGFDPGGIGNNGTTALHVASWNGNVQMVELLLELRAPVNVRDTIFGTAPLTWAARASKNSDTEEDYCRIVEELLDAGTEFSFCVSRWGIGPDEISSTRVATLLRFRGFFK